MLRRVAVALLAVLSFASPSRAADPAAQARELFQRGEAALAEGKSKEAIEAFEAAYRAGNSPSLLFYMAQAYQQAGNDAKALADYQLYLEKVPNGPKKAEAEEHIAALKPPAGKAPTRKVSLDALDLESNAAPAPAKKKKVELDALDLEQKPAAKANAPAAPAPVKATAAAAAPTTPAAAAAPATATASAAAPAESPKKKRRHRKDAKETDEASIDVPLLPLTPVAPARPTGTAAATPPPNPPVVAVVTPAPPPATIVHPAPPPPADAHPAMVAAPPAPAPPSPMIAAVPNPIVVPNAPLRSHDVAPYRPPAPPPPAPALAAPAIIQSPPPQAVSSNGTAMRDAGLIIGTVGIAGLAAGGLFGLGAKNASDDLTADAGSHIAYDPATQTRGQRDQTLEIAFLAGGAACLVGGTILYLVSPSSSDASAANAPRSSSGVALSYASIAPVNGGVTAAAALRF